MENTTGSFGEDWKMEMLAFDKATLVEFLKESQINNKKMEDALNFILADVHLIEEKAKKALLKS